ncbi:MAG: CNNM domain-containing protein [Planctomycetota bacterium]
MGVSLESFFDQWLGSVLDFASDLPLTGSDAGSSLPFNPWLMLATSTILVILNGFFAAAEFALVEFRFSQLENLVTQKKMFAKPARWLAQRLDHTLSACQIELNNQDVDTLAGVIMSRSGKLPKEGDQVSFGNATAEIPEVRHNHAFKILFTSGESELPSESEANEKS